MYNQKFKGVVFQICSLSINHKNEKKITTFNLRDQFITEIFAITTQTDFVFA